MSEGIPKKRSIGLDQATTSSRTSFYGSRVFFPPFKLIKNFYINESKVTVNAEDNQFWNQVKIKYAVQSVYTNEAIHLRVEADTSQDD